MMQQFALMGLQSLTTFIREGLVEKTGKSEEELFADLTEVHNQMFQTGKAALLELGFTVEDDSEGQMAGTAAQALSMLYVSHGATVFKSYLPDGGEDSPSSMVESLLGDMMDGPDVIYDEDEDSL